MPSAHRFLVAAILALHATLLAWLAARHSPTIHEMAHLPAGISNWQFGVFELYRVNAALRGTLAALPVLLWHPETGCGSRPAPRALARDDFDAACRLCPFPSLRICNN